MTGLSALALALSGYLGWQFLVGGSVVGAPSTRALLRLGAIQPYLIARGGFWRLIAATFLHASVLHAAFKLVPAPQRIRCAAKLVNFGNSKS